MLMCLISRRARSALAIGAVSSLLACSSGPTAPSPVATGTWGGDHISLTVASASSHAEFDCAHGEIAGPLVVDARHAFNVSGTFVREHGGPVIVGAVPDSHPAVYFGTLKGDTITLTVQLVDTKDVIGTFTLTRNTPGRVVKCLLAV